MKQLILLGILLSFSIAHSQQRIERAVGTYLEENGRRTVVSGNREVIWSEDFTGGIGNGWLNSEQNGIAQWEFRGPDTTPNVETGSRGSCVPVGTVGDPIASPSWDTGFVIFDSNWWDNPDMPCAEANFGTGPAPGPHIAMLTTPSIDLSGHTNIALTFNQYLKMYSGQTRIEVSANGGPWNVVFENPIVPNPTLTSDQKYIQLSAYAGGQADVKIRFVFDGLYYFWQLDDMAIVDTYGNDLATRNSTYGDFDLFDLSHPTGYEFMEYSKYPDEMPPLLKFSTQCENLGGNVQTDCRLAVEVRNQDNSLIHSSESDEGFVIASGSSNELRAGSFQMPATVGQYTIAFQTNQTQTEEFELNNRDTMRFIINDVQYARDRYFTSSVFLGPPEFGTTPYEIGNIFLMTADGMMCHSISVAVGVGTSTPATIRGVIYSYDFSGENPAVLIASTAEVDVTPEMINSYGDQILTNLVFPTPVPVSQGVSYYVAVACDQGPEYFVCALSGDAPEFTSLIRYLPNNTYSIDRIPIVRMNFGPYDEVREPAKTESNLMAFPIPAEDVLHVSLEQWKNKDFQVAIYDKGGRLVLSKEIQNNSNRILSIEMKNLISGVYDLVIYSKDEKSHLQFVKK